MSWVMHRLQRRLWQRSKQIEIAPNLTLQEEFIHHWKAITNYFIENKASPDLRSMILSHYHAVAHPFRMNSQSPPVAHSERAFVANRDERLPADQTNLPSHLEQMLSILQQEEQTCESGSTGPCMEYMLHHKLLETLYTLGKNDLRFCLEEIETRELTGSLVFVFIFHWDTKEIPFQSLVRF
eukprot:XP_014787291.1 PREDICTED: uncharacterized protein LOC106881419 [Octopus bimaculoides]